jgi:hypothetical protein
MRTAVEFLEEEMRLCQEQISRGRGERRVSRP